MQDKRRLIIVTSNKKRKRLERFKQEADLLDIKTETILSYDCEIMEDGIYSGGRKIVITENDVCWCISNSMVNHYLIRYIKSKKIFVWPSVDAIDFSDKFITNSFFNDIGVDTPKTILVNSFNKKEISFLAKRVGGFPCVIKSNKGSMGKSVEIINSEEEIIGFMKKVFKSVAVSDIPFKKLSFQLQEFIKESAGEDYRIICLDGEVLGGIKRVAKDGFKANISLGGKAEIFKVDGELKNICKKIMKKGNVFYAGIDFVKSDRGYLAIEINSSSQFQGFEKKTKVNLARKIIEKLVC